MSGFSFYRFRHLLALIGIFSVGLLVSCAAAQEQVSSYLEGEITVSARIDSSGDYSGFEVVVGTENPEGGIDTLASSVTNRQGHFEMDITAPRKGIYSILILRNGNLLTIGDIAVAKGDSAAVNISYPLSSKWLPIRSTENASWLAYNNTRIQHTRQLAGLFQGEESIPGDSLAGYVHQTANLLWSLRTTFPSTIGAAFAEAESVTMLEGWSDSLAIERAQQVKPGNPRIVGVARAVRRAVAREQGQQAAVQRVKSYIDASVTTEDRAALQAELVRTHLDSLAQEQAVKAAQVLKQEYPDSPWATWADRAEYEANNLMPGMAAPNFTALTAAERSFDLKKLKGQVVVLEFWAPQSARYRRQLPQANQLYQQIKQQGGEWVAVNMEADPELYEVFKDGRTLPGIQINNGSGAEGGLAKLYNLSTLPTRFLIDREGNLVGKYVGSLSELRADLLEHLEVSS